MKETRAGSYTDEDEVRREVVEAQRLFEREGWPTIDVSRRSIEETAAAVLNLLAEHRDVL
jgi:regulator of PEP synthase PpsR (kinase-PPPase family)